MREVMNESYFSKLEKIYFNNFNTWKIEEGILYSFAKNELKRLIEVSQEEYLESKLWYNYLLARRLSKYWDEELHPLDRYLVEQMSYHFDWWKELDQNNQFLDRLKRFYKMNYEIDTKYKKSVDINSIPIKEVVSMYARIPNNLRRNIRCILPDHKDKSASFRIYENSNSYYCFWCHKWWNIINFISEMENISTKQAYKKAQKLFW